MTSQDSTTPTTDELADCRATLHELQLFLDGELPEGEREHVLGHLHECLECYQTFDFHVELREIIASKCADERLPDGLLDRIRRSLADEPSP